MINLLSPEEKNRLLLEERKKIITILWFLFLFFLFCFTLILFSIRFYLQGQVESQKIIFQQTQKSTEQFEIKEFQEKFNSFNIALVNLDSFYKQKVYFSEILEKISKILHEEAYLTNISVTLSTDKETPAQVALSGFIPNRENLFEFKKTLEKEEGIKEVSFPPTNWVNPVDINFFVTFKTGKK